MYWRGSKMEEKQQLIFERSRPGRTAFNFPDSEIAEEELTASIPSEFLRDEPAELPEVSELQLMRHYTELSNKNYGVDTGFYPLGSCSMKYNPKVHEDIARMETFTCLHPYQPAETAQGALEMLYGLQESLQEITGMDAFTLQPSAGAQGEWTGLKMVRAYHEANGEHRMKV